MIHSQGSDIHSRNEVLSSLYGISYLQGLPEKELAPLAEAARRRHFEKGDLIFSADQRCRHLHILSSGEIKVFMVSEEGKEQIIHLLRAPVFFGEEILFGENKYEANAQALCKTISYDIAKEDLESFIVSHPRVAIAMLAHFGERMKRLMKMIGDMALKDAQYRLVCHLVRMAREVGEETTEGIAITGLTHQELASHIGTGREHLSRCLARLQDSRMIKLSRKKIVVRNLEALQDLTEHPQLGIRLHITH